MSRSVGAFAVCLVVGIALYPALIGRLARVGAGQRVSQYNPTTHRIKAGTPTMGGVLFCVLAVVAWMLFDRTRRMPGTSSAACSSGRVTISIIDCDGSVSGNAEDQPLSPLAEYC